MPPTVLGLVLHHLRSRQGLEPDLAELTEERLREIAAELGYPTESIDALLFADKLAGYSLPPEPPSPVALDEEERRQISRMVMTMAWTSADGLGGEVARASRGTKTSEARDEAEELLKQLLDLAPEKRRREIEIFPEYRSWALAVRLCKASVDAAADKVEDAFERAELARQVTERVVEVPPGFRLRLEGYCLCHLSNAYRVANDFDGADETFARGKELWEKGTDAELLLDEWQVLSLEASLRREQHRFAEALELLDRARAGCGNGDAAVARLLLQKEHIYEQRGDIEAALAVLEEAAPFVERSGEARFLSVLRFNTADNLCRVGRYEEAAKLLRKVYKLAVTQGKELDLMRVRWLQGRIQSGLGERLDAMAALEQVQDYFTNKRLPYDAALSGLDIALLRLEMGHKAKVRELAAGMAWIFKAKKIDREALAALHLFCEAAGRESATAELTRQVIAEVERVRRTPPRLGATRARSEAEPSSGRPGKETS